MTVPSGHDILMTRLSKAPQHGRTTGRGAIASRLADLRADRSTLITRLVAAVILLPALLAFGPGHPGSIVKAGQSQAAGVRIVAAASMTGGRAAVTLAAAAAYFVFWFVCWPRRRGSRTAVGLVAGGALLAAADQWLVGPSGDLWLTAAVMAGAALRPRWAIPAVAAIATAAGCAFMFPQDVALPPRGSTTGAPDPNQVQLQGLPFHLSVQIQMVAVSILPILIAGFGAILVMYLTGVNRELRAARADQARMAVDGERVRVARDLHDVLGRNLSLIAVRLQVAEHLIRDGDGVPSAADDVREVRDLTLSSLRDVRDTVAGYRVPTIDAELAGAGIALSASRIALDVVDARDDALPPDVDAACAWIVREATTNILRHSRARRCSIMLVTGRDTVRVRIADDGIGGDGGSGAGGTGLEGLRERVVALGGTLDAGPRSRGFTVAADIPLALEPDPDCSPGRAPGHAPDCPTHRAPSPRRRSETVDVHA